jgi:hypothetical protein
MAVSPDYRARASGFFFGLKKMSTGLFFLGIIFPGVGVEGLLPGGLVDEGFGLGGVRLVKGALDRVGAGELRLALPRGWGGSTDLIGRSLRMPAVLVGVEEGDSFVSRLANLVGGGERSISSSSNFRLLEEDNDGCEVVPIVDLEEEGSEIPIGGILPFFKARNRSSRFRRASLASRSAVFAVRVDCELNPGPVALVGLVGFRGGLIRCPRCRSSTNSCETVVTLLDFICKRWVGTESFCAAVFFRRPIILEYSFSLLLWTKIALPFAYLALSGTKST